MTSAVKVPEEMADRPPSSTGGDHRDSESCGAEDLRTTTIYSSLSSLFLNEKFSDMSIHCRGREFKAHRAIVCSQSSFFDRAMAGGFKVGNRGAS